MAFADCWTIVRSERTIFIRHALPSLSTRVQIRCVAFTRTLIRTSKTSVRKPTETFVGRAAALADIDSHFADARLVTIVGLGGVGKTRLATEWLRNQGSEFFGASAVARLEGVEDDFSLLGQIAAAVGMAHTDGKTYVAAIGDWLRGRDFLLVLDNCEHIAELVAPLVDELLGRVEDLSVLATSRRPLVLPLGAIVWLEPLPVPRAGAAATDLAKNAAVSLFIGRARAQAPEFEITNEALEGIAALCRAVDGLPLALELAAGWIATVPVSEVLDQLDNGLAILQRLGTMPARHAKLTDTLAWSHSLLTQSSRVLLRRLAVFPAGCSLGAVQQVCVYCGLEAVDLLPALRELVECSLVRFDRAANRYHLFNTVRHFAIDHSSQSEDEDTLRTRHANYFRDLGLQGRDSNFVPESNWLPRLLPEVDSFHLCLGWLLKKGRAVEALELSVALTTFWWLASRHREGIRWLQATLAKDQGLTVTRAAAHFSLGFLSAHDTGEWSIGAIELEKGIALLKTCTEDGADLVRGYLLCLRGECENMSGRPQTGLMLGTEGAVLVAKYPEDRWGQGFAAWNVGFGWERTGDLALAAKCYEDVVEHQRDASQLVLMIGCQSLARVRERQGDLTSALPLYDEALKLWEAMKLGRLGDVHGSRAQALVDCARVRVALGGIYLETARQLVHEATALAEDLVDKAASQEARVLQQAFAGKPARRGIFRRQGRMWLIGLDGCEAILPDTKGLRQLRLLLQSAGSEISAAELAAGADGEAREIDNGSPVLDALAISQYRKRLAALERVLELDDDLLDADRRRAALEEHRAISLELSRGLGLRGKARKIGSPLERMRVNVTRTLRAAICDIGNVLPELGKLLHAGMKTGGFCVFRPLDSISWQF